MILRMSFVTKRRLIASIREIESNLGDSISKVKIDNSIRFQSLNRKSTRFDSIRFLKLDRRFGSILEIGTENRTNSQSSRYNDDNNNNNNRENNYNLYKLRLDK
jgi:hypothetical protein